MPKGQSGPKFLSVSSNYEAVPLVPGPPGVWRAADVATKTQQKSLQQLKDSPLNAGRELGIESSQCGSGAKLL